MPSSDLVADRFLTQLQIEFAPCAEDPPAHATRARLYAKLVAGQPGLFVKKPDNSVLDLSSGGGASSFIANSTSASGTEDTPLAGNVLSNVSSPTGTLSVMQFIVPARDGNPATVYGAGSTASLAGQGSVTVNADGTYAITPLPNYSGVVGPVVVWVSNDTELRTKTLQATFAAVNDPPVAGAAYGTSISGEAVDLPLLVGASDIEGDTLSVVTIDGVVLAIGAPHAITDASLTYLGAGVVRVTPSILDGIITCPFTISDGALTATGTLTVRVGVDNVALFSPVAPLVAGNTNDDAARNFLPTFLQEYSDLWPNIGPDNTPVDLSQYTTARGYKTWLARENWLYDAATMAYVDYLRTGREDARLAAIDLCERYMLNVVVSGGRASFTLDGATDDPKYMYPTVAVVYERLTGSTVYRTKGTALYQGLLYTWPKTYVVGPSLWTERGAAFAILGCLAAHVITGDQQPLTDATEYVDGIIALSTSGAPLHGHDQHEGDSTTTPITSPWMGAFLAESMLQFYRLTEDARVLTWLSNYVDWLMAHATYVVETPDEPEFAGMVGLHLFAYLAGAAGPTDYGQADDMQHARDVGELLRKGRWAKLQLSLSTAAVDAMIVEQDAIAVVDDAYWTRLTPGLAKYRYNPSRKRAWQLRNGYAGGLYHVGIVPLAPILITASTIAGSAFEGATLTLTPATWNGRPTPTLSYQWYRDAVAIVGATGLTYVTVTADVGHAITAGTDATNTGGAASSVSNAITVLAAGTPVFDVQPTSQTAEVGQTAVFTVTVSGTPAPTLQWQRRATSGDVWANVSEGTGGTTNTYTTEALAAPDNGNQLRCAATNVLGTIYSNTVAIAMIVQQPAAVFTAAQGAQLATTAPQLGDVGLTGFTLSAKVKYSSLVAESKLLTADALAGRLIGISSRAPAATVILAVADHIGLATFATPPPANTWLDVTLRAPAAPGGNIVGTWQLAESAGAVESVTNVNDVENSLACQTVRAGAGSAGSGGQPCQIQYVGIYNRILSDGEVAALRTAPDYATAYSFWVFSDAGGGVLAVRDASGNGRVPTLTGGTVTAAGPVAPTVP